MTDYIGITEAQSNPFAPLTSELVKQLRDNPIAIAEGASGAPRVWGSGRKHNLLAEVEITSVVTEVLITGLPPHVSICMTGAGILNEFGTFPSGEYQVSSDNGATWVSTDGGSSVNTNPNKSVSVLQFGNVGRLILNSTGIFLVNQSLININAVRLLVSGSNNFASGTVRVFALAREVE
jgi:hypothetical protein